VDNHQSSSSIKQLLGDAKRAWAYFIAPIQASDACINLSRPAAEMQIIGMSYLYLSVDAF